MNDTGYHYIFDLKVSSNLILCDPEKLNLIFTDILSDFTILKYDFHKFGSAGEGVTGLYLLSESHCSYHTYPENHYIAIDIFTCGRNPGNKIFDLTRRLDAVSWTSHYIKRGSQAISPIHPECVQQRERSKQESA